MKENNEVNTQTLMFMLERLEKNLERLIHYAITLFTVIFIASIIYGAILGDFVETESVGSVMCLSCMGLQQ
ncbi:hypothetical protein JXB22_02745 [candidate division WOR-3 bacterium]|nr:hypothetical protein [candidate division WOR-3 bacterium]